jgi:hypothetical protein
MGIHFRLRILKLEIIRIKKISRIRIAQKDFKGKIKVNKEEIKNYRKLNRHRY